MTKLQLKAEKRKVVGRKVKTLRAKGMLPGNIYGKDVESVSIQINSKEFRDTFKKAGETSIVEISLGTETRPVLISEVQVHPATDEVLHVDFRQVNLKEKVTAQIPVEISGESPVEKSGLGTVVLLTRELEVEALPADLPEKFDVDASKLTEVDQAVKVSDLKVSGDVEIKADPEQIVVKVEPPQKEEEVVAPPAPEGEEAVKEGEEKVEEGTQPAEAPVENKE
jgi:large subunit ribosomal protein L25